MDLGIDIGYLRQGKCLLLAADDFRSFVDDEEHKLLDILRVFKKENE